MKRSLSISQLAMAHLTKVALKVDSYPLTCQSGMVPIADFKLSRYS